MYGTPYTDDIGPGKTYVQGYTGPDLLHSMYIDYSSELLPASAGSPTPTTSMTYSLLDGLSLNDVDPATHLLKSSTITNGSTVIYTLSALGDLVKPADWTGQRVSPGKIQAAEARYQSARAALYGELQNYNGLLANAQTLVALYQSAVTAHNVTLALATIDNVQLAAVGALQLALNAASRAASINGTALKDLRDATKDGLPKTIGTANDLTFPVRLAIGTSGVAASAVLGNLSNVLQLASEAAGQASATLSRSLAQGISAAAWNDQNNQLLSGLQTSVAALDTRGALNSASENYAQSLRDLQALRAEGDRIQQARLVFRQNSAALIQGYRTRDFAFRAFRDEALERYKSLFDLAALYTYLAARAYDYETGLLDASGSAKAATFYQQIVQARALGVVTNGQPQFAGARTGDPGLSGVLAAMSSDWSVVKTRLGFNNPSRYNTTFSLRGEKFRILPGTEGDQNWQAALASGKMANILDDPDVKRYCMHVGDASGLPVPGFVIPFQTTITDGFNYFGVPLAAGDHTFTPSTFATKIRSSGVAFSGYIGMDSPSTTSGALAGIGANSPASPSTGFTDPQGLSATPYIYLIPAGADSMLAPPLGDTSSVRTWQVEDQAIPLPFNIGNSNYSTQPAWVSAASLSEAPFTIRKHSAFRAVPDGTNFSGGVGFTNARLIGRSVWNSQWKIVIPANTLLNDPAKGMQIFADTVKDIKLHLETYSYSGN